MKKLLCVLVLCNPSILFSQNPGSVQGKVTDKNTNLALDGVTVLVKGTPLATVTNGEGYFLISAIPPGKSSLVISHIGYETVELSLEGSNSNQIDIGMELRKREEETVVVSASKYPEKMMSAAASISVIGIKNLEQFAGSNVGELVNRVQGIEATRSGVEDVLFNARGFNNVFNNKVLQLVDCRNSMTPLSGGLPLNNRVATNKDDIERYEIVLGPQSSLYGPNALNAVMNIITKDPRKYEGTTVSITGGNQYQFSGRIRQAARINNRWAYKFTGEYAAGKEYEFYDTVYAGGNAGPVPGGYGPPVAIPERNVNFKFRHIRGEGHVYYRLNDKADIIVSGGGSSNDWLQVTTAGRNQMKGLSYTFLQAKLVYPNLMVNVYNSWGDIGNSYVISAYTRDYWNRTHSTITEGPLYPNFGKLPPDSAELFALRPGNSFKEKSQRFNGDAQYNHQFNKAGLLLLAGLSYQQERPNAYGVALVDKTERINIIQYGAALQLKKTLPLGMQLTGAARFDYHSNFGNFVSPKFSLTKAIGKGNIRINWGRAYAMPSILFQYANIAGLIFGNGEGITYIPNGSNMKDPGLSKTTIPLKPEEVSTWELGYKGTIAGKLYLDINVYAGLSKNFISPPQTVSGRALSVGDFPVTPANGGILVNDTLRNASFLTYFNYGLVHTYGIDAGATYYFNDNLSLALKYSLFGSDITKDSPDNDANHDGVVSAEERSLNAPKNRIVGVLNFQNLCKGKMYANIAVRFIQQYDFYSGNQIGTAAGEGKRGIVYRDPLPPIMKNFDWGPLGGFTSVDVSAGYTFNDMVQAGMGITNLFNTRQIEFVGSPSISRLLSIELRVHVPNRKNK